MKEYCENSLKFSEVFQSFLDIVLKILKKLRLHIEKDLKCVIY